jgi:hypothetical protein
MNDLDIEQTRIEACFSDALEAVASGLSKTETIDALGDRWGTRLTIAAIEQIAREAFSEALQQGVEREDIDPSWF